MDIKKHFKKKDWVYYLTVFVGLTLAFSTASLLFSHFSWLPSLLSGLASGAFFTLLSPFVNLAEKDINDAVEEDKRMGLTKDIN